ncbi:transposase, partial [Moorena sp. SIO3H5]|uniref:RNA-guided endonuclease InsQ/TnpB family protein n=1 Tax=Moorena sp. SIO3H5 TaxID=2607834 RepID=UPI0025EF9713
SPGGRVCTAIQMNSYNFWVIPASYLSHTPLFSRGSYLEQAARVKNLVKNHCLAKSINDAGWYKFREWLEYFGQKFGRITVAVNPAYTSQNCSDCGEVVKKSLSTRTHVCKCGCRLDSPKATLRERDHNAARNILTRALGTVGHTGTFQNAWGDLSSTLPGSDLVEQDGSMIQESPGL